MSKEKPIQELPFDKVSDNLAEYGEYVAMQQKLIADLYLHFSYANKSLSELNNLEKSPVILGYKPNLEDPQQLSYYKKYIQHNKTVKGNIKVIANQAEAQFGQIASRFRRPNPTIVRHLENVQKYLKLWEKMSELATNVKEYGLFLDILNHIRQGKPIELKESPETN